MDNTDRARRALKAIIAGEYNERDMWEDRELAHQAIKDLLCDLHHLSDRVGVDFGSAYHGAYHTLYRAELVEDDAGDWPIFWPLPWPKPNLRGER